MQLLERRTALASQQQVKGAASSTPELPVPSNTRGSQAGSKSGWFRTEALHTHIYIFSCRIRLTNVY